MSRKSFDLVAESFKSDLFRKGVGALLTKIGGLMATYVLHILYVRNFGSEVFGEFIFLTGIIIVISQISSAGLGPLSLRVISSQEKPDSWSYILLDSLTILLILQILTALLLHVFEDLLLSSVQHFDRLLIYSIVPLFAYYKYLIECIRAKKYSVLYSFFAMAAIPLLSITIFTIFLPTDWNLNPLSIHSLAIFITLISITLIVRSLFPVKRGSFSFKRARNILRNSLPFVMSQSMTLAITWTDSFMVNHFMSDQSVGIFFSAAKISSLIVLPAVALNTYAAPKISSFYSSGQKVELIKTIRQTGFFASALAIPVLIVLVLFPGHILSIYNEEFIAGRMVLTIIAIGHMISTLLASAGTGLEMTGNQHKFLKCVFVGFVMNVILNYTLIPIYGINGAAIASSISLISSNILFAFYIYGTLGFVPYPKI